MGYVYTVAMAGQILSYRVLQNLCNRKLKTQDWVGRHKVYPSNEIHTSFISNLTVTPVSLVTDISAAVLHYIVSTVTVATTHRKST